MQHLEQTFHLRANEGQIGRYCLLPGDPGRCEAIASHLEDAHLVGQNREYCIWSGKLDGELVSVCSTGIGGPSTAIAVEELVMLGADTFIRVGTCGGIDLNVCAGDMVIATAAVRQEGTSREYAPIEFPAVADFDVCAALGIAAKKLGAKWHAGVVQSKDSFYGQHSPKKSPIGYELVNKWDAWKRLGVKASEMEAATLYTVAAALGVRAGGLMHVIWNQEREAAGLDITMIEDTSGAIKVAVQALRELISRDKQ